MFSNQSHQSFDNGMNFSSFDTISDDSFFDFHGASTDGALPEVEQCNELPSDFVDGVSLADIEQPLKSPGSFFDSAFGSDDTSVSDIHNDMLVWPSDHIAQEVQCTQTEIMSSPPISHAPEMPNAGLGASPSPIRVSESMGPREQLWRPMVLPTPGPQLNSNSPEVKNTVNKPGPTPSNKPGPKPGTKSKVSKVNKKKSTVAQKRTPAIPEQRQRSIQELYNATWDSLSQDEKGRLLLPLLQGINPATGKKVAEASTMLPTPDFEAIGADVITNHPLATSSPAATMTTLSASSPSSNTTEVDYDGIGADYSPPNMNMHPSLTSTCSFNSTNTSVDTDFANMTAATLQEFNRNFDSVDNFGTSSNINSADCFLTETNRSFGRGLGGPYGNRMTSDPIQIPAPPSVYGCTRQQEALERNVMLRAQGRRR